MKNTYQQENKQHFGLWTIFLFFAVVFGAWREYQLYIQPLDEAVAVVYSQQNGGNVIDDNSLESKETNKPGESVEVSDNVADLPDAMPDFLKYIHEIRELANSVDDNKTVLDKIKQQNVKMEVVPIADKVFQDGQIEVYDEKKGVVEVIKESQVKSVDKNTESAENKEEKSKEDLSIKVENPIEKAKDELEKAKENVVDLMNQVQETIDNSVQEVKSNVEEVELPIEEVKASVDDNLVKVKENIQQHVLESAEGEEAPIVLIPGLNEAMNAENTPN